MSSSFFTESYYLMHIERFIYLSLAFIYALFEGYSQTYVLSTRLAHVGLPLELYAVCIAVLFFIGFYFSLTDGYRILTSNKMQLVRNTQYCLRNDRLLRYKRYVTFAVLATFFLGFCHLLPYHFASVYFTNYLALSLHVSMSVPTYGYYLGLAVVPDLVINAVNITHNAIVSLRSLFEGVLSLRNTSFKSFTKSTQYRYVDVATFMVNAVLYGGSLCLARVMSLAIYMNYQDYMGHYCLISNSSIAPLRAGKSLYYLLYFRSLGNFIKLSQYIVTSVKDMFSNLYAKWDVASLFSQKSVISVFGHFACALRAYSRAIRVSGYAPMLYAGTYHYLDKASSNPIATISMVLPPSKAPQTRKSHVSEMRSSVRRRP